MTVSSSQHVIKLRGAAIAVVVFAVQVAATSSASAQSAPESETFEVASIRPVKPDVPRPAIRFTPGGGVHATNVSLKLLIEMAYEVRPEQLRGGAGWMESEFYDLVAKSTGAGDDQPDADGQQLVRKRLRALLSERFHLVIREDSKLVSGYALIVGKKGHKLTASSASENGKIRQVSMSQIRAEGVSLELLARFLSVRMGQSVVDHSQLTGLYDFTLHWALSPSNNSPAQMGGGLMMPSLGADASGLLTAVDRQLGLKLQPQKNPAAVLTILSADRPTAN